MPNEYIFDIYEIHFFIYDFAGYGYLRTRRFWQRIIFGIYNTVMNTTLLCAIFSGLFVIYDALGDAGHFLFILTINLTIQGCTLKSLIMEIYKKELRALHEAFNRDMDNPLIRRYPWSSKAKAKAKRQYLFATIGIYSFVFVGSLTYLITPVLLPNERAIPHAIPWKNIPSQWYEAVYVVECIALGLFILNVVSHDLICVGFLLRLSCHLEIISESIRRFGDVYPKPIYGDYISGYRDACHQGENDGGEVVNIWFDGDGNRRMDNEALERDIFRFLRDTIEYHKDIIREVKFIDKAFNKSFLLLLIGGTLVFALGSSIMFSSHLDLQRDICLGFFAITGFADLYVYCYCGTQLLESAKNVAFSLYSLPWYEMDVKFRKIIIFMLLRLSKIKGLSAGGVAQVNLEIFLQVLKFSHSFIALLSEF